MGVGMGSDQTREFSGVAREGLGKGPGVGDVPQVAVGQIHAGAAREEGASSTPAPAGPDPTPQGSA